jgi:putative copper export protein
VAPPLAGAAVLVRLAILAASLFYLTDLVSGTVVGSRRAVALAAIVVVAVTMAVQPTVAGQPSPVLAGFGTAGHLLAAAAWLGGLVALATVVRPGADAGETGGLVTRFSPVATLGLVLLVLASGVTVLAGAADRAGLGDGASSGLVLRLGLLVVLLVAARYAHRVTTRLAFRRLFSPMAATGPARDRALTLVLGTELAIAFGALSAAMLVCLTA